MTHKSSPISTSNRRRLIITTTAISTSLPQQIRTRAKTKIRVLTQPKCNKCNYHHHG
uniref:Uncharacterized protein n=1 Tax=Helianthus annuus TaxID=4232 RepID=A0A251URA0_HELAN